MKTLKFKNYALFLGLLAFILSSCKNEYPGFDKTETGLYYKFHTKNDNASKAAVGDVLYVRMYNYTEKDTVLDDYRNVKNPIGIRYIEPLYDGDINEGLAMLAVGDSATFIVNAKKFFTNNLRAPQMPEFIDSTSVIYFNIKLESIKTKAEFEAEMAKAQAERDSVMKEMKNNEETQIADYLKQNRINAKPTLSGLYIVNKKVGKGKAAQAGKMVKVNYTGYFFDGTIFDTSNEDVAKTANIHNPQRQYAPIEFVLGTGQVIKGWDEGIATLKVGGVAKFVIPSYLAYGEYGSGPIRPFTPLVFDVELVDVVE